MPASRAPRGIIPAYAGSTSGTDGRKTSPPDHPRIRGEHRHLRLTLDAKAGSSPHTRGARHHQTEPRPDLRIIPAYAGSTSRRRPPGRPPADHPRIRGEHQGFPPGGLGGDGSSPHTRGARPAACPGPCRRRIIPAYAGGTAHPAGSADWTRDHPRIRGEHIGRRRWRRVSWGSSPHTRGAPSPTPTRHATARIIPAYAGSTRTPHCTAAHGPDHPRIRGEHVSLWDAMVRVSGSSPHTRGALLKIVNLTCREGIIPAYAGSTFWMLGFVLVVGDHPRIRGEHREYFAMWVLTHGSSPHTRGALALLQRTLAQRRIIPAYAGSTPASPPASATRRDHPRIRGEHETLVWLLGNVFGSSPHTRGAPLKREM